MSDEMDEATGNLTQYDEEYLAAPTEPNTREEIPDGKYQVSVEGVEMKLTRENALPMFCWKFKVLGPLQAGRYVFKNHVINSKEKAIWLKNDLVTCHPDFETIKLSEVGRSENLEKLLDIPIEINVKTNGKYKNVYLNRRIEGDSQIRNSESTEGGGGLPF